MKTVFEKFKNNELAIIIHNAEEYQKAIHYLAEEMEKQHFFTPQLSL